MSLLLRSRPTRFLPINKIFAAFPRAAWKALFGYSPSSLEPDRDHEPACGDARCPHSRRIGLFDAIVADAPFNTLDFVGAQRRYLIYAAAEIPLNFMEQSTVTTILGLTEESKMCEADDEDEDVGEGAGGSWLSLWLSSTLKKRRAKMNKHKLRKRRKKERLKNRNK